jgi:hypothetical protein
MSDDPVIIYGYTLEEAIEDGVLVEVCKPHWPRLTGGKPLVASSAVYEEFSLVALMEIWNEFVHWSKHILPNLAKEEQLFTTQMNSKTVWLLEDGAALTILFPEDY